MAQRPSRTEAQEPTTTRGLRSVGSSSDVISMSTRSGRPTLPHANPPPAYVADSAAENLLYAEIELPVRITSAALALVNGFLDQVLYDILSKSHSTSISALRSAVPLALKPRLGRSAVKAADEELQDYLDEHELADLQTTAGVLDPRADFDVDLAWMLTRLRCMVYAKLGDMEEEDEEDFLDDEDLRYHITRAKESLRASATITPASAIFLTTVLEFLAEQALCIAAQHARKRHNAVKGQAIHHSSNIPLILDEIDMSGIGKEGPLIRLWRSWKGSVRTTGSFSSRPTTPNLMSPVSPDSPTFEWKSPSAPPISTIEEEHSPLVQPSGGPLPADIPLPMSENDVEEIEVPGLAHDPEGMSSDQSASRPTLQKRRPSSMLLMPGKFPIPLTPAERDNDDERPSWSRTRSQSLPTPAQSPNGPNQGSTAASAAMSGEAAATAAVKGRESDVPSVPSEPSGATSRSNVMNTTVATIVGALNVEASRGLRRDRYSQNESTSTSHEIGPNTRASLDRGEDSEQRHVPARAQTMGSVNSTTSHDDHTDPEDLALSVGDERENDPNNRANPRDSGFGVAVPENFLPIQDPPQTQVTPVEDPSQSSAGRAQHPYNDANTNEQANRRLVRVPYQGYVAVHQSRDAINDNTGVTAAERTGPTTGFPAAATTNGQNTSSSTSAWPAVVPDRGSSLEQQGSGRSSTEMRFPQHLPQNQRVDAESGPRQEFVPHYATSAFVSAPGSHSRTHSAKDSRPGTAGSSTARRQHIRLRSNTDEGNKKTTPPEEVDRAKKSLDVLIDSDETLHYTLTPEPARAANEASRPKVKSQTQELADFFRNTAPPGEEASRPRSSRSAKDGLNGLRSNPPGSPKPPVPFVPSVSSVQQSSNSPSKPRNPLGEPRDARMARGTTRDLADYARSTGPEHEMQLPKPLSARPNTAQGPVEGDYNEKQEGTPKDLSNGSTRPSTTSSKAANRLKYQARDARAPRTAESSDLIDFIREGPPRAPGEHRIDRHVAPFRTTMDSDDLNALAPPPDLDVNGRNSDGSAQESAMTVKSMPSSMNSRTGLLESSARGTNKFANGFGSGGVAVSRQPVIPESDGMPPRTRRRVRDPYAIDFSDEEDDEEMEEHIPRPQRRGDEESLVDFLRNTAPPPGMTTLPILAANPNPTQPDPAAMVKRSASSSKLRDYLQGGAGGKNGTAAVRSSNTARAESPHLTQIGSKLDKYRPTQPTHAAHVERNRQKARVEPRDPMTSSGGGTADLAAYLLNSGPPPGSETQPQPFITSNGKDQAGFMKFFSRRASVRK